MCENATSGPSEPYNTVRAGRAVGAKTHKTPCNICISAHVLLATCCNNSISSYFHQNTSVIQKQSDFTAVKMQLLKTRPDLRTPSTAAIAQTCSKAPSHLGDACLA